MPWGKFHSWRRAEPPHGRCMPGNHFPESKLQAGNWYRCWGPRGYKERFGRICCFPYVRILREKLVRALPEGRHRSVEDHLPQSISNSFRLILLIRKLRWMVVIQQSYHTQQSYKGGWKRGQDCSDRVVHRAVGLLTRSVLQEFRNAMGIMPGFLVSPSHFTSDFRRCSKAFHSTAARSDMSRCCFDFHWVQFCWSWDWFGRWVVGCPSTLRWSKLRYSGQPSSIFFECLFQHVSTDPLRAGHLLLEVIGANRSHTIHRLGSHLTMQKKLSHWMVIDVTCPFIPIQWWFSFPTRNATTLPWIPSTTVLQLKEQFTMSPQHSRRSYIVVKVYQRFLSPVAAWILSIILSGHNMQTLRSRLGAVPVVDSLLAGSYPRLSAEWLYRLS